MAFISKCFTSQLVVAGVTNMPAKNRRPARSRPSAATTFRKALIAHIRPSPVSANRPEARSSIASRSTNKRQCVDTSADSFKSNQATSSSERATGTSSEATYDVAMQDESRKVSTEPHWGTWAYRLGFRV
jgi:hypothetical protein